MEPKKLKRLVIKEELVALMGDCTGAIVLQQFVYWSERTRDAAKMLQEERDRHEQQLETDTYTFEHGWIYKTAKELAEDELMNIASERTIRRKLTELVELGLLSERSNPLNKWDKTKQYRLNINLLRSRLHSIGYALEGFPIWNEEHAQLSNGQNVRSDGQSASPIGQNDRSNGRHDRAISEITTEITFDDDDICESLKLEFIESGLIDTDTFNTVMDRVKVAKPTDILQYARKAILKEIDKRKAQEVIHAARMEQAATQEPQKTNKRPTQNRKPNIPIIQDVPQGSVVTFEELEEMRKVARKLDGN